MSATTAPVAASAALREVLRGPRQPARLIGVTPAAAYLELEQGWHVIGLVTRHAVRLPCAVVVDHPLACPAAEEASVGAGRVTLGDEAFVPWRWWDPHPRLGRCEPTALGMRLDALDAVLPSWTAADFGPALHRAEADLAHALDAGDAAGAADAAAGLIGLGPGLTPSGDDVCAGVLAALRLLGPVTGAPHAEALADAISARVRAAAGRTTSLSAALLRHADAGAVAEPAAAVLQALVGRGSLEAASAALLAVGHTSGHDLARGILAGGRAAVVRATEPAGAR